MLQHRVSWLRRCLAAELQELHSVTYTRSTSSKQLVRARSLVHFMSAVFRCHQSVCCDAMLQALPNIQRHGSPMKNRTSCSSSSSYRRNQQRLSTLRSPAPMTRSYKPLLLQELGSLCRKQVQLPHMAVGRKLKSRMHNLVRVLTSQSSTRRQEASSLAQTQTGFRARLHSKQCRI